jgi:hypothetical protein
MVWYHNRLASMSVPEVLHRVSELAKRRLSRGRYYEFRLWLRDDALPILPGLADGAVRLAADPAVAAAWGDMARTVASGGLTLLNRVWTAGSPPDWHLDPVTGRRWPDDTYCFDIPYRHANDIGDVRYAWELGRLQYLQPVAAHAHARNDAAAADLCMRHLESWINANPPYRGVHWSSGIKCSLRLVSLLVVNSLIGHRYGRELRTRVMEAVAAHVFWIERFPSRFSSANNHLIAEAAGCFLVGLLTPGLRGAARFEAFGRRILEEEAQRQFHADGIAAEQSPSYGAFSLEFLTLCAHVGELRGRPLTDAYRARLLLAGRSLRGFLDERGNNPAIGDEDGGCVLFGGIADRRYVASVLAFMAAGLGEPTLAPPVVEPALRHALFPRVPPHRAAGPDVRHFADGGYTVARTSEAGREILTAMDHGPLGYLSIAAHGHADTLAVWLHIGGRPVLVDAGTYLYHSGGEWRDFFRGTAAHNTLSLRGLNSSRIAGPFNWAERATCRVLAYDTTPDSWFVEASHDGYAAATGYRHVRRIGRLPDGGIEIVDRLDGSDGVERVEIGFLFAPDLAVSTTTGGWLVSAEGRPVQFHHPVLRRCIRRPWRPVVPRRPRFGDRSGPGPVHRRVLRHPQDLPDCLGVDAAGRSD